MAVAGEGVGEVGGVTGTRELGAEQGIDVAGVERRVDHTELMLQDHKLQYQHQEEEEEREELQGLKEQSLTGIIGVACAAPLVPSFLLLLFSSSLQEQVHSSPPCI